MEVSVEKVTPNSLSMRRTSQLTPTDRGPTMATKPFTGGATVMAKRSVAEIAQLFGSTSAKITSRTVIARVA